jgi:hypothetical protein
MMAIKSLIVRNSLFGAICGRGPITSLMRRKVLQPHRMLDGESPHDLWAIDAHDGKSKACTEIFCGEARHLMALGWVLTRSSATGAF